MRILSKKTVLLCRTLKNMIFVVEIKNNSYMCPWKSGILKVGKRNKRKLELSRFIFVIHLRLMISQKSCVCTNKSHKPVYIASKGYNVLTMLIKEVFPAPFGPSIPKHSPRGTARDNPLTASFGGFPSLPGYIFLKLLQTMEVFELGSDNSCSTLSLCFRNQNYE